MADGVVLTPRFYEVLRSMAKDYEAGSSPGKIGQSRHHTDDDSPSPEVYVILSPEEGIPGLSGDGVIASSAVCPVYRLLSSTDSTATITLSGASDRQVYNLKDSPVPGNHWCVVSRDKIGFWVVVEIGGSADGSGNNSTTTLPPTTSTTPPPCNGTCVQIFNYETSEWEIDEESSNCTYPCGCKPPDFCPPDTAEGTGSGTGTEAGKCSTHTANCQLIPDGGYTPVNCSGTTAPPPYADGGPVECTTTTSTTTLPPACLLGCDWYVDSLGRLYLISNKCASGCPCPSPAVIDYCAYYHTDCVVTPIPTPPCTCCGDCEWVCATDLPEPFDPPNQWLPVYGRQNCVGYQPNLPDGSSCQCAPPPNSTCLVCTDRQVTGCAITPPPALTTTTLPPQCTTAAPTTTRPPTSGCSGTCYWRGDGDGGWADDGNECFGGCTCYPPGSESSSTCDVMATQCLPTTTTIPPANYCVRCLDENNVTIDQYCIQGTFEDAQSVACELKTIHGPYAGGAQCLAGACSTTTKPPTTCVLCYRGSSGLLGGEPMVSCMPADMDAEKFCRQLLGAPNPWDNITAQVLADFPGDIHAGTGCLNSCQIVYQCSGTEGVFSDYDPGLAGTCVPALRNTDYTLGDPLQFSYEQCIATDYCQYVITTTTLPPAKFACVTCEDRAGCVGYTFDIFHPQDGANSAGEAYCAGHGTTFVQATIGSPTYYSTEEACMGVCALPPPSTTTTLPPSTTTTSTTTTTPAPTTTTTSTPPTSCWSCAEAGGGTAYVCSATNPTDTGTHLECGAAAYPCVGGMCGPGCWYCAVCNDDENDNYVFEECNPSLAGPSADAGCNGITGGFAGATISGPYPTSGDASAACGLV